VLIELHVAGKATTKQRPRFDPRTRRAYTPPSNIINENDVRSVWRDAGAPRIEGTPPIEIELVILVVRPQGHFNSKGELNKKGLSMPYPSNKRPDVDNGLKLVMDALNSRAYHDDVQVCRAQITREWSDWAETIIRIKEMK
jgi:Holliday junction resolvase RusA-like endonuclease